MIAFVTLVALWLPSDATSSSDNPTESLITYSPTSPPTSSPTIEYQFAVVENTSLTCGSMITGSTLGLANVGGNGAPDVFFRFTLAHGTRVQFSTCGSRFDTWLRVLSSLDDIVEEGVDEVYGCDDCGTCGRQTIILISATADEVGDLPAFEFGHGSGSRFEFGSIDIPPGEYILQLEGHNYESGEYLLDIECATFGPTSSPTQSLDVLTQHESPKKGHAWNFLIFGCSAIAVATCLVVAYGCKKPRLVPRSQAVRISNMQQLGLQNTDPINLLGLFERHYPIQQYSDPPDVNIHQPSITVTFGDEPELDPVPSSNNSLKMIPMTHNSAI